MADETLVRDRTARARTRPGRLACLDRYLVARESSLLQEPSHGDSPIVDVGFGDSPITTLQYAEAARSVAPSLPVTGYEVDAGRAAHASSCAGGTGIVFSHGGFREVASGRPKARVIRVMNVLRSYPPESVLPIRRLLGEGLVDGGLLLEGTSDTEGHVLTAFLMRSHGVELTTEGLLLFTDYARGFNPWLFRDYLPRELRRAVTPGTAVHDWLSEWEWHWAGARERGARTASELFRQSLLTFGSARADVDSCQDLGDGFVIWSPTAG